MSDSSVGFQFKDNFSFPHPGESAGVPRDSHLTAIQISCDPKNKENFCWNYFGGAFLMRSGVQMDDGATINKLVFVRTNMTIPENETPEIGEFVFEYPITVVIQIPLVYLPEQPEVTVAGFMDKATSLFETVITQQVEDGIKAHIGYDAGAKFSAGKVEWERQTESKGEIDTDGKAWLSITLRGRLTAHTNAAEIKHCIMGSFQNIITGLTKYAIEKEKDDASKEMTAFREEMNTYAEDMLAAMQQFSLLAAYVKEQNDGSKPTTH